jgi:hypothetical protein
MRNPMLILAAGLAALTAPSLAQAKNVTADPGVVAAALQKGGYRTEITKDSVGDPLILSSTSGYNFGIYFYGCDNGKACKTVQFSSSFDPDTTPGLTELNQYARENRWGRVYLDEDNDPVIEMDIDLEDGGMSEELFIDNLEYFELVMSSFAKWVFKDD